MHFGSLMRIKTKPTEGDLGKFLSVEGLREYGLGVVAVWVEVPIAGETHDHERLRVVHLGLQHYVPHAEGVHLHK